MNAITLQERSKLAQWIDPKRTALLIIDIQGDFASPDGAMARLGCDLSSVPAAIENAERLTDAARAAGAKVVFVCGRGRPGPLSPAKRERLARLGYETFDGGICVAGTPGGAFIGPQPLEGESIVAKNTYSGFFRTELDDLLRASNIDTIVVCGLTTECCVDGTVRDGYNLEYHVFMASDACAAYEPDLHHGALKCLELNCAILATTDQVVAAWAECANG
jgi:ureidoacrylate peracid hydrolase